MISGKRAIGMRVGRLGQCFDRLVNAVAVEQAKYWEKVSKEIKDRNRHQRHIIGLADHSVKRLVHMSRLLKELKEYRTYEIKRHLKDVMGAEMKKLRFEVGQEVKTYLQGVQRIKSAALSPLTIDPKIPGHTRVVGRSRFIRDGKVYRQSYVIAEEDDLLKFKALLQMEQVSFSKWLRRAMRSYVGARFKKLEGLHDLKDTEGDPIFTDEEVERILKGGDIDAQQKTDEKGKKEVVGDSNSNQEDLGGGK